jgi:hypothetical protein
MTVQIKPRDDGNWTLEIEWANPGTIQIEDGELHELQERLNDHFTKGPFTRWLNQTDLCIEKDGERLMFRQVGWLGQTGNFYKLDNPGVTSSGEPGGFSPIYIQIESD